MGREQRDGNTSIIATATLSSSTDQLFSSAENAFLYFIQFSTGMATSWPSSSSTNETGSAGVLQSQHIWSHAWRTPVASHSSLEPVPSQSFVESTQLLCEYVRHLQVG